MEYISELLGMPVQRMVWNQQGSLPVYLAESYRFEQVALGRFRCLFLQPLGELASINAVQKHLLAIRKVCDCPVVLELPALSRQRRATLIGARISFVVPGKQLYLPFIGTMLTEKEDREPTAPVLEKLQPSAQMLLFALLLHGNQPLYLSALAKRFGFSAMTSSRAAQQLVATGYLKKESDGIRKRLTTSLSPGELYEKMKPYCIHPVRKTLYLPKAELPPNTFLAGLSALSERSMLLPPVVETRGTVALPKTASATPKLLDTNTQCAVQLWKYDPRLVSQTNAVDALSLAQSFQNSGDERIEQCVDELLKKIK